ncbi:MAG: cysteine dioxygenase [Gammaproteobacteria bacterium]|nr:cysteine dioxygenase [Gammaproteobacteria bacterium]
MGEKANIKRLREFVRDMTALVEREPEEADMLSAGRGMLRPLISNDDWLPDAFAEPAPDRYRQYLLHCDPLERFSVVSFVWGPGQRTPVHDHTVWGLVGVMRGAELCEEYACDDGGLHKLGEHLVKPGGIDAVSPTVGDIHVVSNASPDRVAVSIHVYGANIGAVSRHVFDAQTGEAKPFISGYSNAMTPNLWDRSAESA